MITLKKTLSALLISVLLVAVTGVSFSRHICLSGKSMTCAENESCCKDEHSGATKTKCCEVQNFYFKADIISTHDNVNQKFFLCDFISIIQNHFYFAPFQYAFTGKNVIHKPPLLQSSRSILLDSSRLTV